MAIQEREADLEILTITMSCLGNTPLLTRPTWRLRLRDRTFPHAPPQPFGYDRRLQNTQSGRGGTPRYPYMAIGRTLDVFGF
jgi:hypothetical protein